MQLVAVHHSHGLVPVEQVERHRNDGRIEFGSSTNSGKAAGDGVKPVRALIAWRADSGRPELATEGWDGVNLRGVVRFGRVPECDCRIATVGNESQELPF